MEDEFEKVEGVVEEWIEEIEKMKKSKSPFEHLIIRPVEVSAEQIQLLQKKVCLNDHCCGNC